MRRQRQGEHHGTCSLLGSWMASCLLECRGGPGSRSEPRRKSAPRGRFSSRGDVCCELSTSQPDSQKGVTVLGRARGGPMRNCYESFIFIFKLTA